VEKCRYVWTWYLLEDRAHNYAEKTYLRIRVVDPHHGDTTVPDTGVDAVSLRELPLNGTAEAANYPLQDPPLVFTSPPPSHPNPPHYDNNVVHGGDALDGPDGLVWNLTNGMSDLPGNGPQSLRAVARRRWIADQVRHC
jgi:hypothetical protein